MVATSKVKSQGATLNFIDSQMVLTYAINFPSHSSIKTVDSYVRINAGQFYFGEQFCSTPLILSQAFPAVSRSTSWRSSLTFSEARMCCWILLASNMERFEISISAQAGLAATS